MTFGITHYSVYYHVADEAPAAQVGSHAQCYRPANLVPCQRLQRLGIGYLNYLGVNGGS